MMALSSHSMAGARRGPWPVSNPWIKTDINGVDHWPQPVAAAGGAGNGLRVPHGQPKPAISRSERHFLGGRGGLSVAGVAVPLLMFTKQDDDRVVVVVPGQFCHEHGTAGGVGVGVEDQEILPVGV